MKNLKGLKFTHVDVFGKTALAGNGLIVFYGEEKLSVEMMQNLTREMRQFESIFFTINENTKHDPETIYPCRIFTKDEELEFAGHPVLGAAGALHNLLTPNADVSQWKFQLASHIIEITTEKNAESYLATMKQNIPTWGPKVPQEQYPAVLKSLNLMPENLYENLPIEVITTGFPYLIVPLKSGMETAKISRSDFAEFMNQLGAKEAYLFNINTYEGRIWDNSGTLEDIATGSAAGPIAGYLARHKLITVNSQFIINQGRFVERPSQIIVKLEGKDSEIISIKVSGEVHLVAQGLICSSLSPQLQLSKSHASPQPLKYESKDKKSTDLTNTQYSIKQTLMPPPPLAKKEESANDSPTPERLGYN